MGVMNTSEPAKRFRVLGVNDESDFCECCGKIGLKRVVWIEDTETGSIQHFGVICAANPKKAFGIGSEIKRAVRADDKRLEQVKRAERNAAVMREREIKHSRKNALYAMRGGLMKQHTCENGLVLTIPADSALMEICHREAFSK